MYLYPDWTRERNVWQNSPTRSATSPNATTQPQAATGPVTAGGFRARAPQPPQFSTWPNVGKFGFLRPSFNRWKQPSVDWLREILGQTEKMGWM